MPMQNKRASIIPVMVDPKFNCVYVLLGRSRAVGDWIEGSLLWSEFGGTCKAHESPETTAAREVCEESLGLLLSPADAGVCAKALADGQFVLRVEIDNQVWFIVRFAWNPMISFLFSNQRKQLSLLAKLSRGLPMTQAERLLACRMKWLQPGADPKLQALLNHPALHTRRARVPASVVQIASDRLSDELCSKRRSVSNTAPLSVVIVDGVSSSWMEKDQLQLFSIQQLGLLLQQKSLHATLLEVMPVVLRALTSQCMMACSVSPLLTRTDAE